MNKYEKPEMQIIEITANDVITTSGGIGGDPDFGGMGNED